MTRFGLGLSGGRTSCLIRQPLADDSTNEFLGANDIAHAKGGPIVEPEIELRQVAVQMLLGAVLVVPRIPRLNTEKKLSTLLVITSPRTYSLAVCLTVS